MKAFTRYTSDDELCLVDVWAGMAILHPGQIQKPMQIRCAWGVCGAEVKSCCWVEVDFSIQRRTV